MTIQLPGTGRVVPGDDGRQPESKDAPRAERAGFLLDLITGADSDTGTLRRLVEAGAIALTESMGVQVDCAATLVSGQRAPGRAANNGRAVSLAYLEQELDDGPMTQAIASDNAVLVESVGTPPRWQEYRSRFPGAGYGEALAVPLRLDAGTRAALAFFTPPDARFGPAAARHATWFAGVAAQSLKLALEVHSIRSAGDNLKTVLEGRTSIDVACGVIMGRNRCSYTDAFSMLASESRHRNRQVREVAEGILKTMPSGSPGPARGVGL